MALKILHILDHSLPLHSGYTFRSDNIFHAQIRRGWQPIVITSPKHEENWKGQYNSKEIINDIQYYRTGTIQHSVFPFETERRLMTAIAKNMRKIVETEKPDIIHAHSPILNAFPALKIGHKLGIPVVYEIRAFWEDAAIDHGTYVQNSYKYRFLKFLETWVCRKADRVITICNGLKEDLIKRDIPSSKINIVPNGVCLDVFKIGEPDIGFIKKWSLAGKKIIGFIGSFYRYEGINLLIDAVSRISKTRNDIMLLIVGGGEMEKELSAQIRQLKLERRVIMPGRISHDLIPGIYALFDIMVYPRYSMRLTELVTPLKPLEAMAMGKVVVASNIGGHRELIQHGRTGLLFRAGDVSALVKQIESLLDNHDLYDKLGKQGNDWVCEERSWDKSTAVYEDLYNKALARSLN